MKYEFHPEAELEVLEAAARYEAEVPGLGLEFGEEVERVIVYILAVAHGSREPGYWTLRAE
jgi:hypothetical protein